MRLMIDASVAVKWFVPESGYESARRLGHEDNEFHAPDLILLEVFNALWKVTKNSSVDLVDPNECLEAIRIAFAALTPSMTLIDHAARLASVYNHPIYDCLYLADAERTGFPLVTADIKLAKIARRAKIQCIPL